MAYSPISFITSSIRQRKIMISSHTLFNHRFKTTLERASKSIIFSFQDTPAITLSTAHQEILIEREEGEGGGGIKRAISDRSPITRRNIDLWHALLYSPRSKLLHLPARWRHPRRRGRTHVNLAGSL